MCRHCNQLGGVPGAHWLEECPSMGGPGHGNPRGPPALGGCSRHRHDSEVTAAALDAGTPIQAQAGDRKDSEDEAAKEGRTLLIAGIPFHFGCDDIREFFRTEPVPGPRYWNGPRADGPGSESETESTRASPPEPLRVWRIWIEAGNRDARVEFATRGECRRALRRYHFCMMGRRRYVELSLALPRASTSSASTAAAVAAAAAATIAAAVAAATAHSGH